MTAEVVCEWSWCRSGLHYCWTFLYAKLRNHPFMLTFFLGVWQHVGYSVIFQSHLIVIYHFYWMFDLTLLVWWHECHLVCKKSYSNSL